MLYRRHDAPRSEEQWKAFLLEHRFGQLVAAGAGSEPPFVIPAHFSYDGDATIPLHLHRDNPVWKALEQNPVAVMAVIDAYAFIPSYWNEPKPYGVATSFYAAIQAIGTCQFVDDPDELANQSRGRPRASAQTRQARNRERAPLPSRLGGVGERLPFDPSVGGTCHSPKREGVVPKARATFPPPSASSPTLR